MVPLWMPILFSVITLLLLIWQFFKVTPEAFLFWAVNFWMLVLFWLAAFNEPANPMNVPLWVYIATAIISLLPI